MKTRSYTFVLAQPLTIMAELGRSKLNLLWNCRPKFRQQRQKSSYVVFTFRQLKTIARRVAISILN